MMGNSFRSGLKRFFSEMDWNPLAGAVSFFMPTDTEGDEVAGFALEAMGSNPLVFGRVHTS
jgi:hypothetical protein